MSRQYSRTSISAGSLWALLAGNSISSAPS